MSAHTPAPAPAPAHAPVVPTPQVVIPSSAHPTHRSIAPVSLPVSGFVAGTMITCKVNNAEQAVAVENLKPGMMVKTANGQFRPVDKIGTRTLTNLSTADRIAERLYTIPKASYPSLTADLTITGTRSVLIHSATDAQRRQMIAVKGRIVVTDKKFGLPSAADGNAAPNTVGGAVTVYDFSLVNPIRTINFGVYANGLLVDCANMVQMMNPAYTLIH